MYEASVCAVKHRVCVQSSIGVCSRTVTTRTRISNMGMASAAVSSTGAKEKPWQLGRQLWLKKAADGNIPWSNTLQSIRISSRRWRLDASGEEGRVGKPGRESSTDHPRHATKYKDMTGWDPPAPRA